MKMMSFENARQYIQGQSLLVEEWEDFCDEDKPKSIPSNPEEYYENEWVSWEDWIGINQHASIDTLLIVGEEIQKFLKENDAKEIDIFSLDKEERYLARWQRRYLSDTEHHKQRLLESFSSV